ncbi:MAG: protein-L-isoaspartate(D-aspartate) O-methyltransferase [Bacteroidales bacterium]|nr:protein-L-isoaspartate(D-aspartate) O-methyltransferase [Bacteroidales bacterium]MCF8403396.1 protein-L-isoaspartate(D-aspartate) O-methyltransferase [Bacteroidales bacterium]
MLDTYKHKGMRKKLRDILERKGISDQRILNAIETVPRHVFMDSSFLEFAYEDKPFPIGSGQTISQPYTVAFQTELLNVEKGDKILEIGTGSGYQSCILLEMGAKVYTIERQKALYLKTKNFLQELGYRPKMITYGDGYKGMPTEAPFDKIIVTAGAPFIPQDLVDQLKPGGILVIPVGTDFQIMKRIMKGPDNSVVEEDHGSFRFVPLLSKKADD